MNDLTAEDNKFLEIVSKEFAITSIEELLVLVNDLKEVAVKVPILKELKSLLEETQAYFKKEKVPVPNEEVLNAWKDFSQKISGSNIPNVETFVLYLWNYLQIQLMSIVQPSDDLFLSLSMRIIEKAQENKQIAQKFTINKSEAYFLSKIGYQYYTLFLFGPKNKNLLENALTYFKEATNLLNILKDYYQLANNYALISAILRKVAQFYIDTDPSKFLDLITNSYESIMSGVEITRQKDPSNLSSILIDASASVSELGRLQTDLDKGVKYLEKSIALAEEGLDNVDPNHEDIDGIKEGLYNNIGVAYSFLGFVIRDPAEQMKMFNLSLENKFKGLDHAKKSGVPSRIIRDLGNIGHSYQKMAIVERDNYEKFRELLQKAIDHFEEALKLGDAKELDSSSIQQLLMTGEALSNIYANMITIEQDHDKTLDWLSKKLKQDRKNIQLAKQWNVRPMLIANNSIAAATSINKITTKIDNVMVIRELYQEQIELLEEAIKILEELKTDDEKLINCYRNICGTSQELSRLQPDANKKYDILLFGKGFGDKAYQLVETIESPYLLIDVCNNYGLLVHDIGHAIEHSDREKAREFFTESIEIFQKGLEAAKDKPETIASQAVLLDYVGGSYRDLANLADDVETKKDFFLKSAAVKEESYVLFEKYRKAPYDTAVTADSLAITLQQLGRIEDDSKKAIEIFQKAIKYAKRAQELFTLTRIQSKAFRSKISVLVELQPNVFLHSAKLEKNPEKQWEYVLKARKSLQEGAEIGKSSPMYRVLGEYLLWEYPKPLENGVEHAGFQVIWDPEQEELKIINMSYDREIPLKLGIKTGDQVTSVSEVKFEVELGRDRGHLVPYPRIRIIFQKNKELHLKIPTRIGARMLERKTFQLTNPNPDPLTVQLTTTKNAFTSTETHLTIVGERNIFMIGKKPVTIHEKLAVVEFLQEDVECLYQINIIPRFSGILTITNPDIKKWKYNLGACLIEGPLMFEDAPHIVETDFSPIIFMDGKGNLPSKFFKVENDMKTVSGSLVDLNVRYPRIIRKIFIMGEVFKEKPPYERIELLNLLKEQITNIATVNDPFSGVTILTSDVQYFNELYPLIEKYKMALAQSTDFIRLSQVAKLLEIRYVPEQEVLPEIGHLAANIRWLTFENIIICDDPILAFLAVPWCRYIDAFLLQSSECQTEKGKLILGKAKNLFIIGDLENEIPKFADKQVENLTKDPVALTYELHGRLKERVGTSWDHFIDSEYRGLFPQLRREEFAESVIITSKQANNLSYLILASNYAAAKLSAILLVDRDETKLKIEADLFKQLDQLTYKRQYEEGGRSDNLRERLMRKMFDFSKDLRKKYFDEQYIKLLDQAKFISIITDIPIPLELMQFGEGDSLLAVEKAVGRLCSTNIEETSILIQYSVLQAMMQSSDVKKATIISPKYFDRYTLYYGKKEVQRGSTLLGKEQNLGEENIELLVDQQLTKQQFVKQLEKNPWLFIHYIGHGDLVDRESAFMVQPSEFTDLVPVGMHDLPSHLAGQPVFIANACLSGRYQESAEGLSGLVFEIIKRGAISFIGTLWEVDDYFAAEFIAGLYLELLNGKFLGDAVQKSRRGILDKGDPTYGAYILFGDPMVRIR